MNIKVVNAGNCMMCGRKIKIITNRGNDKFPNIFFCSRCEKRIKEREQVSCLNMREETHEEQKAVEKYLKKISKPTGENFWDLVAESEVKNDKRTNSQVCS